MKVERTQKENLRADYGDLMLLENGQLILIVNRATAYDRFHYVNLTQNKLVGWDDNSRILKVGDGFDDSNIAEIVKSNDFTLKF